MTPEEVAEETARRFVLGGYTPDGAQLLTRTSRRYWREKLKLDTEQEQETR